jgi:type I restriction enzyme S subunit
MPNINTGIVRNMEVRFPDRATQRLVVGLLSAYDDLIENNTRRIQILEEMALAIYREWFVEFRYPGREGVARVDSGIGPIPEGWSATPVGSVVEALGGGTPAKDRSEYWEGGTIEWFTPTDLTAASSMFISESKARITPRGLASSSARLFPARSVMMTSRATIGVVSINTQEAATNQGFITCVPNDRINVYHLYFWLKDNVEQFSALASGATFKEINKSIFRSIPIVVAEPTVERDFADLMKPIGGLIENLLKARSILRNTRDLLLPRLISGEIDVSELDIDNSGLVA